MAPSAVNDSARAMMARLAEFRDDTSGLLTTGGTSTAYTVTTFQGLATIPNDGQLIAFSPHTVNGIAATLTADGGTTYPIQSSPGVAISAGSLVTGSPYTAKFSLSNLSWILFGFYANPFNIPLACGMDYWAPSVPNSNFAFPIGQAISRTTYATLFALVGTTYGVGDGVNTFNIPDKTGRVSAMKEASATRLTATYFGGNSVNLGAVGGLESSTLLTGNLPPYTPAGTVSVTTWSVYALNAVGGANSQPSTLSQGNNANTIQQTYPVSSTFTGTAQGGVSTPVRTVPPTIICNYIMRII